MPRDPRWCSSPEGSDREDAHRSRRCHRAPARAADPGGDGHRGLGAGRGRSRADPHRLARPADWRAPATTSVPASTTDATASRSQPVLLQRKCACGAGASGLTGECEECSKKKMVGLQTKLRINQPGDIYEQEADRVAEQVLAKPAYPPSAARRRASSAFRDNRAGRRVRRLPA